MSLTSLLKGSEPSQKEFQAIIREIIPNKKSFNTYSGKEAFSKTEYDIFVPYNLSKSYNSTVVGTAFDYLARIMLARVVEKNRDESYTNLTAINGIWTLSELSNNNRSVKKVERKLIKTIKKLKAYSHNNKPINELALDVCFLAKLESIYRSRYLPDTPIEKYFFDEPEYEIIKDLELLCDVFQEKFISTILSPTSEIIYNPHFGVASSYVGGADGDVIVDGTLYDFKTGKGIGYKWQEVAQIVGYYLLNQISIDIKNTDDDFFIDDSYQHLDIKRLALYRARYGEIEYIDISCFDKNQLELTKKKLIHYFYEHPNFSKPMIESLHILRALAER